MKSSTNYSGRLSVWASAIAFLWVTGAAGVRADYIADFSSSAVTNDFQYAMIGSLGSVPGSHNSFHYNNGLRLEGRYSQIATVGLKLGDDGSGLNNGRFTNGVTASMTFNYSAGVSSNVVVAMGLGVRTNSGANTYPAYRAVISTNTLTLQRQWDFSATTNLGSFALNTTLSLDNEYRMAFSSIHAGQNDYGTVVDLSVLLYENDILIASILYTDTPTALTGSGATIPAGYVGIASGSGPQNDGTMRGITVTEFSVVPEPASAALTLSGLAAIMLASRRKRTR